MTGKKKTGICRHATSPLLKHTPDNVSGGTVVDIRGRTDAPVNVPALGREIHRLFTLTPAAEAPIAS